MNPSPFETLRQYIWLTLSVVLLTACANSDNDENNESSSPALSVSGIIFKGPVDNSQCTLSEVENGQPGNAIATSMSNASGNVNFGTEITYTGTAIIECNGGMYNDEVTGVDLPSPRMRAVVSIFESGTFTISPLTEIAIQQSENNLQAVVDTYNMAVANSFALTNMDITLVAPSFDNNANNQSTQYATVLALVSQLHDNSGKSLTNIINEVANDISDDGELSIQSRIELGQASVDILLSSAANLISIHFINTIAEQTDAIVLTSPVVEPDPVTDPTPSPLTSNNTPTFNVAGGFPNQTTETGVTFTLNVAENVCLDADNDTLTMNFTLSNESLGLTGGTSITGTPTATGSITVTFSCTDPSGASASATFNITIISSNMAPVANNLTASVNEDRAQSIVLAATDIGGRIQSYIVTQPQNGSVVMSAPSIITYTPTPNFNGIEIIEYFAIDNDGAISNVAEITVTVNAVNDAPTLNTSFSNLNATENATFNFSAPDNACTDIDGETLTNTFTLTNPLGLTGGANITGTPSATGTVSVVFNCSDSGGLSANASFEIIVAPSPSSSSPFNTSTVALSPFTLVLSSAASQATISENWLNLTSSNSQLSGTPTFDLVGQTTTASVSLVNGSTLIVNVFITEPSVSQRAALRMAEQATFGMTPDEMESLMQMGITTWVDNQLNMPSAYDNNTDTWLTHFERTVQIATTARPDINFFARDNIFNAEPASFQLLQYQSAAWYDNALGNPDIDAMVGTDSLRQRMAYALSQLLVVSDVTPPFNRRGEALAAYYDILARNALGNFRTLLGDVARSPAMGVYLSHQGNRKTDLIANTLPDENFAREIMQLFTIGLSELNQDGSPNRDGNTTTFPDSGTNLVPAYTQTDVSELAKVMTGWDLQSNNRYGNSGNVQGDYSVPMEFTPSEHEDEMSLNGDGMVTVLGNTFALNSGSDNSGLDTALDILFNHPNVPPFISRHIIQRFVTSNPSSGYIERVANVFSDNGSGVRGDLKTVLRTVLLDDEARSLSVSQQASQGKVKEPLLAMLQLFKVIGVEPLDGWISRDNVAVNDTYWYPNPRNDISQGPMRSLSVFNFYSPDFVPSDSFFSTNRLLSPESQLYTDQVIINLHNRIQSLLNAYERNRIQMTQSVSDFAATRRFNNAANLLLDFTTELQLLEMALEGDTNGDFININNDTVDSQGTSPRERAIDALLDYANTNLFGNTMDTNYRAALKHYLLAGRGTNNSNTSIEATNIVLDTYRFIGSSGAFLIQK